MRKPDTILDEIHATRRKLEEQTKEMSPSQRTLYFNKRGESVAQKHGFNIVASAKASRLTAV